MIEAPFLISLSYYFVAFCYGGWSTRSGGTTFEIAIGITVLLLLSVKAAPWAATIVLGMVSYWAAEFVPQYIAKKKQNSPASLSK